MEKVQASVIIPAYNSHRTLQNAVEALMNQTAQNRLAEIIIVDSSDDPEALKQLKELEKNEKIRVITSGVKVMPAKQRNIGAGHAKSELLCFLDSDAYPEEEWIEKIIDVYSSGVHVGGGSYKIPEFQQDSKIAKAQYYLEFNEFMDIGKPRAKRLLPSCNLFCQKDFFHKLEGFPEIRASEDTLFGLKVNNHSKMMFFPEISVYHIFRDNPEHYYKNQVLLGKYIFIYRKYFYNSIYYKGILPYLLFPSFILIKLIRILTRIISAGRKIMVDFLPVTGLFFAGLYHWSRGFWKGIGEYHEEKQVFLENPGFTERNGKNREKVLN